MRNFEIIETSPEESNWNKFELLGSRKNLDANEKYLERSYLLMEDGNPLGRYSFYINPNLKYNSKSTTCIGNYECVDDNYVSEFLLNHAKEVARENKVEWIIGPMNGSTWNTYRFSDSNNFPNFFLEPFNPKYYNNQFVESGFISIAKYYSSIQESNQYDSERLEKLEKYFIQKGMILRNINLKNIEEEFHKIAELSIESFSYNFLYTPITAKEFTDKYLKIIDYLDSQLIWMVDDENGNLQAFVFCIADYSDPLNQTLIIKSVAKKKKTKFNGIARFLGDLIYKKASEMGYKKIIHAFMHEDNISMQTSNKFSLNKYKSYSLYGFKI